MVFTRGSYFDVNDSPRSRRLSNFVKNPSNAFIRDDPRQSTWELTNITDCRI